MYSLVNVAREGHQNLLLQHNLFEKLESQSIVPGVRPLDRISENKHLTCPPNLYNTFETSHAE